PTEGGQPPMPRRPGGRRGGPPPGQPPPNPQAPPPPPGQSTATGTLEIRVQPVDAEILVDGQQWRVPERADRLVVDLADGRHSVQIRRNGYVGYLIDVQVRRGETTPLNVTLRPQP